MAAIRPEVTGHPEAAAIRLAADNRPVVGVLLAAVLLAADNRLVVGALLVAVPLAADNRPVVGVLLVAVPLAADNRLVVGVLLAGPRAVVHPAAHHPAATVLLAAALPGEVATVLHPAAVMVRHSTALPVERPPTAGALRRLHINPVHLRQARAGLASKPRTRSVSAGTL